MRIATSVKADLHIHTSASRDSAMSPRALVRAAKRKGLDAIAVTDHDTGRAWKRVLREAAGFPVILGEEVKTKENGENAGEIIGLFLQEPLRGGTPGETIDQIRDQDGIVVIPHPFDVFRKSFGERVFDYKDRIDALEVMNGRAFYYKVNRHAFSVAREHGFAGTGGSDAHFPGEVGVCYTLCIGDDVEDLRKAIREKKTKAGGRTSFLNYHAMSALPYLGLMREI